MNPGYEFFEHTADIGLRIRAKSLEELFEQAAHGLYAALGRLEPCPKQKKELPLKLTADRVEDLFHDWLSELLYRFETDHVCYRVFRLTRCEPTRLEGQLTGAVTDLENSCLDQEIKAVTYHDLKLLQHPNGDWEATAILDV